MDDHTARHETRELGSFLLETRTVRDHLDDFALRAGHRLGASTEVSISLRLEGSDRLAASSSERSARCDVVEHSAEAGPCVAAMDHLQVVLVPDIADDTRWQAWQRAALDEGFRSAAGVPAHVGPGAVIALDLYSEQVDAWSAEALVQADMFAQDIARTVRLCLEIERLTRDAADARAAASARTAIDRALSVTVEAGDVGTTEALQRLLDAALEGASDPADVAREQLREHPGDEGAPPDRPR